MMWTSFEKRFHLWNEANTSVLIIFDMRNSVENELLECRFVRKLSSKYNDTILKIGKGFSTKIINCQKRGRTQTLFG